MPDSRKKDKNNKVSIVGLKKSRARAAFFHKKEILLLEGALGALSPGKVRPLRGRISEMQVCEPFVNLRSLTGESASPLWIYASTPPLHGGYMGVPRGGFWSTTVVTPPSPADFDEFKRCKDASDLKTCPLLL